MTTIYLGELYECPRCSKKYERQEIEKTWMCPVCIFPISIKIEVGNFFHSCNRVTPDKLRVGEIITLDRMSNHQIISIEKEGDLYRVALAKFGVVYLKDDEITLSIIGSWE